MIWAVASLAGLGFLASVALGFASKRFYVEVDPRIEEIMDALPQANCGGCGYPGCSGYAKDIVENNAPCDLCAPGGSECARKLAAIMGQEVEVSERKVAIVCCAGSDAIVDNRFEYHGYKDCRAADLFQAGSGPKACIYGCLGLGSCASACPFDAISITDDRLAVVDPEKCTACGKCLEVCPRNIIKLIPASAPIAVLCSSKAKGAQVKSLCVVGCTACGICAKRSGDNAIELKDNLPVANYESAPENLNVAEFCPQFTIIDLKRYSVSEWLSGGRESFKKEIKEKKAREKAAKSAAKDKAEKSASEPGGQG